MFFPTAVAGREFEAQVSVAKVVCAGCPVRSECLTWALAVLPEGIAGGMTEHERRREQGRRRGERRRARRAPKRPVGGTRAEIAAAGQAAIEAGFSVREVAGEFLVSPRTAGRWARAVHTQHHNHDQRGCGGGERRRQPGSPPDLPAAQPPGQGPEQRKDTESR